MSTPTNNYIMIANFATAIFVTVSVYVHILHNKCEEIYITKWMSLILKNQTVHTSYQTWRWYRTTQLGASPVEPSCGENT